MEEVVKGASGTASCKYEIKDETTLEISELPLRSWTTDYKDFLENLMAPKKKRSRSSPTTRSTTRTPPCTSW